MEAIRCNTPHGISDHVVLEYDPLGYEDIRKVREETRLKEEILSWKLHRTKLSLGTQIGK